jgi:putative flippase GtrA
MQLHADTVDFRFHSTVFQLVRYCVVGASGVVVNFCGYALLVSETRIEPVVAAVCSFCLACSSNYLWNRSWTFREEQGAFAAQASRFFVTSVGALLLNLGILHLLLTTGVGTYAAQAIAICLVAPMSFVGSKIWAFRVETGQGA